MSTPVCRRFTVRGRVQGVYYRASARERARQLGLSGWARNLDDGSVEVVARGDAGALEALADWLGEGPPRAQVSGVASEVSTLETPAGFEVR
ncbi:MAG: acylphosphatase [Gammaproteobacteria bacterium]